MTRVERSERARQDIDKAALYYADQVTAEVALGLLDELDSAWVHLSRAPLTGSLKYANTQFPTLRVWHLTRYPYAIFYIADDQSATVLRVLHQAVDIPEHLKP